jgi:hypothetical protein
MRAGILMRNSPVWFTLEQNTNEGTHRGHFLMALQRYLPSLTHQYRRLLQEEGATKPVSIPLALVFPFDNQNLRHAPAQESVLQWLQTQTAQYQLLYADTLANTLIKGWIKQTPITTTDSIVVQALDGGTLLDTPFGNEQFDDLGWTSGTKKIFNQLLTDFAKQGFIPNAQAQYALWQQLSRHEPYRNPLVVNNLSNDILIKAQRRLSQQQYYELLSHSKNLLKKTLNQKNILKFNINNIIFVGKFFQTPIFKNFVANELGIAACTIHYMEDHAAYTTLLKGITKATSKYPISFQQTATKTPNRKQFWEILHHECTEKKDFGVYCTKFIPIAQSLGIHPDLVTNYIRHIIYGLRPLDELGEITQIHTILPVEHYEQQWLSYTKRQGSAAVLEERGESKKVGEGESVYGESKKVGEQEMEWGESKKEGGCVESEFREEDKEGTIKSSNPQILESLNIQQLNPQTFNKEDYTVSISDTLHKGLDLYFDIDKYFASNYFLYFLAKLKGDSRFYVFKLMTSEQANDAQKVQKFKQIHEREASYYHHCSSIFTFPYGQYYYREYIEGERLKEYVQRTGLDKKYHLGELKSNELELILSIWRTMNALTFAYSSITSDSFVVTTQRKFPMRTITNVQLINIDGAECEHEEMEEQLHLMLSNLLGSQLYKEIRNTF